MGPSNPEEPVAEIASAPSIQMATEVRVADTSTGAGAATKTDDGFDLAIVAPASWTEGPKSALLKAIVEPDIYTARVDRHRAIALRWVLRDIKNNRLKWWPVRQHDLRDLIDLGLVELRDNAPLLTNAGVNAII